MRVILRLVAKPENVEGLRAVLLAVVPPTRKEPGCRSYDVLQNAADPCDFTLVEHWANEAALDAHLAAPHTQAAFQKGLPLLAQEPDMRRYAVIA